jgi:hypothetical protein
VARRLRPVTPLARLILESGKPAYVVSGEVGINYNRLLDYADGRMEIPHQHRTKLTGYFGADPLTHQRSDMEDPSDFESVTFVGQTRRARQVRGGDALVVVRVSKRVEQARELSKAAGVILSVACTNPNDQKVEFRASVEDLTVKPGTGLEIRLRVAGDERDIALALPRTMSTMECRIRKLPAAGEPAAVDG